MDDCHFLAWPQTKKFLKRSPLLRYIAICKRRWNLTSDSCRAHLLKESFSHISHTFLMALRKRPGICLCGLSWSPNHALSLSLSLRSSIPDVPSRNSSPKKECEFWICFLMDCFARVLHCLPYNFPSSISSVWSSTTYKKSPATVNQHPPVHHEGWMVSSQETVFCWVPVP